MKIAEFSIAGREALNEHKTIIVGMSVNNSYFNEENIKKLLLWARENSESIYVMIPDIPAVSTFLSLGYSNVDAERKARLKSNNLENKCKKIIEQLGIQDVIIIRWEDLMGSFQYLESIAAIKYAYGNDCSFKDALRSTTRNVLVHAGKAEITDELIDYGVLFLLQELAFITQSSRVLQQDKVAYVYHQTMDVLKNIISGRYTFLSDPNVGFVTVE
jgi:tRNA-dependent cyclodipeptide synthase